MIDLEKQFYYRVGLIEKLFDTMHGQVASSYQIGLVNAFRVTYPELNDELDFCFEVLAGKHKLGFTLFPSKVHGMQWDHSIKDLHHKIVTETQYDKSQSNLIEVCAYIPIEAQPFIIKLFNRVYKLGYSNKNNMISDKHCMLAKTYPQHLPTLFKKYFVQEKLNGNRCIAYFDHENGKWCYISRSQKPMNVSFDMRGLDPSRIYDGEIMTKNKMGNKDFAATSGAINSKFGSKADLIYFIYDILDPDMVYNDRRKELMELRPLTSQNVKILKVLGLVDVSNDPSLNTELDEYIDRIVAAGGEGIMLRDPYGKYELGKRSATLLKYKKTKTCDLRIVGYNEGKGKYEGMIGSFICETDDQTVRVNVAGMTDAVRMSRPDDWMGKIIEVAYFEGSQAKNKTIASLQFPRIKRVRDDKTETSMY